MNMSLIILKMKKNLKLFVVSYLFLFVSMIEVFSQNPLITNSFTADPAARQFSDGKLYLYTDCDPVGEDAGGWIHMHKYKLYTTSDLKIWTDEGSMFDCKDIGWNDGPAWDGDCVEANGKYWYYFPMVDKIGVAVSDRPTGPFKDALGRPLVTRDTPGVMKEAKAWLVSPTILFFNGSIYMYFGQNTEFYLAKLKPNMIELDGPVVSLDKPTFFHEGAWINEAKGKIHVTYGGNDGNGKDKLAYATGDSPYGPFKFQYFIQEEKAASVQNCITSFNDRNFIFYHQSGQDEQHRRICVEEFKYTGDGKIPVIPWTKEGIGPVEIRINPLGKHEAEDYNEISHSWGVDTALEPTGEGNRVVNIHGGRNWFMFKKMDFATEVQSLEIAISSALKDIDGNMEVRLDSPEGPIIATGKLPYTGGWYVWQNLKFDVSTKSKGVHDVYFVFQIKSEKKFQYYANCMIDYFRFYK